MGACSLLLLLSEAEVLQRGRSNKVARFPRFNAQVVRLMMSVKVTCCYPLQAHPARACIATLLRAAAKREHVLGQHESLLITGAFVALTAAVALFVDDLGVVLSVVGATGSPIVSYILPGACYYRLFPERASRRVGLALLVLGICLIPMGLFFAFT